MGCLVERVELGAAPRPGKRLLRSRCRVRQCGQGDTATSAVAVAFPHDPVVLQFREQIAARKLEGSLRLAGVEEPVELAEVDSDVAAQLDPLAVGAERGGSGSERPTNRRKTR